LEDYALLKLTKQNEKPYQCALGIPIYGTRMYDSLTSIWLGWRRIYLHAFERRPRALILKFLSVLGFSVIPFFCIIPLTSYMIRFPDIFAFSWGMGMMTLLFVIFVTWKTYDIIRARKIAAFFHPFAALVVAMILLDAFWMAFRKQETHWR